MSSMVVSYRVANFLVISTTRVTTVVTCVGGIVAGQEGAV